MDENGGGPPLADRLRNLPQYLYPQRLISRIVHWATRSRVGWFKDAQIRWVIRRFQVDMTEAAEPDPRAYPTFNAFFTRALRPGARPIAGGDDTPCCPIDGYLSQAGAAEGGRMFQAKGRHYSLVELLGGDEARAAPFHDGPFATFYLSPRDYHRIHMPIAGRLREMVHVPGRLFSVSPLATRVIPALFARNERVVSIFDTAAGPMALVMVGAINVSSMETVWAGTVTPPRGRTIRRWHYDAPGQEPVSLAKGEEMGRFNMGSSVILVFRRAALRWHPSMAPQAPVRMGQPLATLAPGA